MAVCAVIELGILTIHANQTPKHLEAVYESGYGQSKRSKPVKKSLMITAKSILMNK